MNEVIHLIRSNRSFLITSHVRLDGDAVGSELALYHVLRGMGKKAVVYNQDETPGNYRFLPGSETIIHTLNDLDLEKWDAIFVLDCSEIGRVGTAASLIATAKPLVNIDHHISNKGDFAVSFIDPGASSVGELIYRLIEEMKAPLTGEIATNLYTAIMTDTGSFRYSNTGADTFMIAGKLVEAGADPYGIAKMVYENNPKAKVRLLAKVLETLEFAWDDRISTLSVSREQIRDAGALAEHTDNFVDFARAIEGVEVAAFFTEMPDNSYKVSMRSKGRISVERVAGLFGGGGHFSAAACRLEGDLAEAKKRIIEAIMAVGS